MFDIGWGELVVIGIVALIAIGPKELPTVLRSLGQWMGKIRRMAAEFQGQFQEALREAEMVDLKKQADDLTSTVTDGAKLPESVLPAIDVPLPELPAPLTEKDFAVAAQPAATPSPDSAPDKAAAQQAAKQGGNQA